MRISVPQGNISSFQPEKNETIAVKTDLLKNRNMKILHSLDSDSHRNMKDRNWKSL
jgi:hypothetical protein